MTPWVAIDGGQSAVRVQLSWCDDVLTGPGFTHAEGRVERLIAAVAEAVGPETAPEGGVSAVAMGHTGMPVDEAERGFIAGELSRMFDADRVHLSGDTVTAHAGALDGAPGVVISAGTGSVCLAVGADGSTGRVDGWGYLFGDAGGSYAIGRSAIDLAMRHLDGRQHAQAVHDVVRAAIGADLVRAVWDLYSDGGVTDLVARLAPRVVELATEGDAPAAAIVDSAVAELVGSVAAAGRRVPDAASVVSYAGRLFSPGGLVLDRFTGLVGSSIPGARVVPPSGDPLAGSARIARFGPGIHSSLIHTYRGTR